MSQSRVYQISDGVTVHQNASVRLSNTLYNLLVSGRRCHSHNHLRMGEKKE